MKVQKLVWDTTQFGYEVGKLIVDNEFPSFDEIRNIAMQFKLLYVFTNSKLPEQFPLKLVDTKVVFEKNFSNDINTSVMIEEYNSSFSYDDLLQLAFLSGQYSRFRTDKMFKNNEFELLYKLWIDKSLRDEKIKVLIKTIQGILGGFVTLELNEDQKFAQIGLIAVNEKYQGNGIASVLLKMCQKVTSQHGMSKIIVATQYANSPAMSLYIKNGFSISNKTYIYHIWS